MPATVIDGKALAAATKAEAAEKVRELKSRGINPCLAVILVGENPASQVYVRGKINDCAQCGIESRSINLPADTTQDALLAEVKKQTGVRPQVYTYPRGMNNAMADAVMADHGAKVTLTTRNGIAEVIPGKPETLRRMDRIGMDFQNGSVVELLRQYGYQG